MQLHRSAVVRVFIIMALLGLVLSCGGPSVRTSRVGNIETVAAQDGSYKLVYTYDGGRKVMGEYWEKKEKDKKKSAQTNIITSNFPAVAGMFQAMMTGKAADASGIKLGEERDGMLLKFVKKVTYDAQGLPVREMTRGYTEYPILGWFNLSVDRMYSYQGGRLASITERNNNVDTLLLNMGIANLTSITRDAKGRPTKVQKIIGSVPPVVETTTYEYVGNTDNLARTVYKQGGIDFKKLKVVPQKTITVYYSPNTPWEGKAIYNFSNNVSGFSIYNEIEKKDEIDLRNFSKMGYVDKAKVAAKVAMLVKNEMKGPRWRLGELPQVPEPFMVSGDIRWW